MFADAVKLPATTEETMKGLLTAETDQALDHRMNCCTKKCKALRTEETMQAAEEELAGKN